MTDSDDLDRGPNLELPSFGLRRRKQAAAEESAPADVAAETVAEPAAEPVAGPVAEPVPESEPTVVLPAEPDLTPEPEPEPSTPIAAVKTQKPAKQRKPRKVRSRWLGAALIGLVAGFALVGLVNATLRACDAAQGTSSCGGPGLFILLFILVLITVGATRLLRLWGFTDSGTVAFLGVAITAILVLVFLTTHLLSVTMVLVIPVLTALTFVVAEWLSETMQAVDQS